MIGLNRKTGQMIEITIGDPKLFSSEAVRDLVLYPKDNPKEIITIVRDNAGAKHYFDKLCREFHLGVNEIDEQLFGKIERKIKKR